MKRLFILVMAMLLAASALTGCVAAFADDKVPQKKIEYDYTPTDPVLSSDIISEPVSLLAGTDIPLCWITNHGGGQTRMVHTETGVYFAIYTASEPTQDPLPIDLIHLKDDGTVESVFHTATPYRAGGPTVTVMADEEGYIWFYSGVEDGRNSHWYFDVNIWRYSPFDGTTEYFHHEATYANRFTTSDGGGGYSVTGYDRDYHRIFIIVNCGGKPGYSEWMTFDTQTHTFSDMHYAKLDYRYCYTYMVPDGNGGFHIFNQRDVQVEAVKTDNGKNVASASRSLHSNWYDNNMLFDEWDYFHVPDPNGDIMESQFAVEPAVYEVEKGLYPDYRADSSDVFMDKDGYLHFIFNGRECMEYGDRDVHVVYDPKNGMKEVYRQTFNFAGSTKANYLCRMFQDTTGAFYVVAMREDNTPVEYEIWGSTSSTGELKLLHVELAPENDISYSGTAIATNRNGSLMTDTIHMGAYSNTSEWYYFTVDLAKLRDFLKQIS